ncbi:uncharacterized protein [Littorina saxatilis]
MKNVDCSQCSLQCNLKISTEQQRDIFEAFYGLKDYKRQKDFVCSHVAQQCTVTILDQKTNKPLEKKRAVSRKFFLTAGGEKAQVCKRFFLATLDVGHAYVQHALDNAKDGFFHGDDRRGKHQPSNKTAQSDSERVKKHICSFPSMESHYCRKNSNRKFLDSTLNVNRMYRLYTDECTEKDIQPVSSSMYRTIFNTEFNLSFHKPKKDQCLLCSSYLEAKRTNTLTDKLKSDYEEHQARKIEARKEKEKDKQLAQEDSTIETVTFDLESVLSTPCNQVSQTHYKRKLAFYNLTVFSLASKEGKCFTWDETQGKKGSCEIGTCLLSHMTSLSPQVKHVVLYSDTCTGQNRNQYVAAALPQHVQDSDTLQIIDQKYLESGHTQMECDTMHSTIEAAKKNVKVSIPDQWNTVIECARPKQPYTIQEIHHTDVLDLKHLAATNLRNTKTDVSGHRINWLKIKWLRYLKGDADTIFFKYRMTDPAFKMLKIRGASRRGRQTVCTRVSDIPRRYDTRLPVSAAKKSDLLDLCRLAIIPEKHHHFYHQLPSSSSAPDRLCQPDVTEQTDTSDDE